MSARMNNVWTLLKIYSEIQQNAAESQIFLNFPKLTNDDWNVSNIWLFWFKFDDDLLQCTSPCRCGAFFNMLMQTSELVRVHYHSGMGERMFLTVLAKFWYFQVRILLSSIIFVCFLCTFLLIGIYHFYVLWVLFGTFGIFNSVL